MAHVIRIAAVIMMIQLGFTVGSNAVQSMQSITDSRNAALCQVESRYCQ